MTGKKSWKDAFARDAAAFAAHRNAWLPVGMERGIIEKHDTGPGTFIQQ